VSRQQGGGNGEGGGPVLKGTGIVKLRGYFAFIPPPRAEVGGEKKDERGQKEVDRRRKGQGSDQEGKGVGPGGKSAVKKECPGAK